jgi:crotonobetainyl-CoA:carnitine CoA-transferase CaiB-like acyl-CoA transferase
MERQALAGVRVVEFTAGMAGPWIGRILAYCGAEVVKVESAARPDVTRQYIPPWAPEMGVQSQLSPWLTDWNAGKRCVALDLTQPRAVELALRLAACADIVVENYRAGVMEKLGLGYEALRAARPDLVVLSSSGFGNSGPASRYVTWGPNLEAMSGMSALTGFPGRGCTMTQFAYPDAVAALHGLFAVLSALDCRERGGGGQHIDLAQLECCVAVIGDVMLEMLANGDEPQPLGSRSRRGAPQGCYPCRGDDRWCALSVFSEQEWSALCAVLERPQWRTDARFSDAAARLTHHDALDAELGAATRTWQEFELMTALQNAGVAAGVVQNAEDQYRRDPHLAARGFFEEVEHALKGKVVATGIPVGLTATPGRTPGAGAAIGADTERVLAEWLSLSPHEVATLRAAGVIDAAA